LRGVQHHDDTLAAFVAQESARTDSVAVVVTGSVARGTPRPDSDVDVYLVGTEERFRRAWETGLVSYVDAGVATYEGGYVDIKLATIDYLRRAVDAADDPTRASFRTRTTPGPSAAAPASAVHGVNAGGRALPAMNRTLFQGPKYLEQTVPTLPRVPAGYADLAGALLPPEFA
jgi:hypothetical protein